MFSKLIWQTDRMLYEDLIFRLEQVPSDNWYGQAFFRLFKRKRIVDKYQEFFLRHEDFHPKNIFELGIFDGGSIAFWFELFKPNKHIAIDYLDRQDSRYFEEYIQSRGLTDKIKTYWKTNQSDKDNLRKIVSTEFTDPLDLVIDDASHMYLPTRASFETLFPLVKPRGLYIIEDWAWGHWPAYIADEHPWSKIESPTNLITKIIEAAGTSVSLITNITITKGFVVVERGEEIIPDPTSFDIDNYIIKRPNII
ncbi:MAG: class I SAM-dependent methyltransferase [Bacteroidetes bacterium]|nr:class I SAM-dependent methyltransferase [Bacteroidota bacterium]